MNMKTKPTHTPTPWKIVNRSLTDPLDLSGRTIKDGRNRILAHLYPTPSGLGLEEQKANAAFIVRAVNAHEKLVEALRNAQAALLVLSPNATDTRMMRDIEQAIAKAEGRE